MLPWALAAWMCIAASTPNPPALSATAKPCAIAHITTDPPLAVALALYRDPAVSEADARAALAPAVALWARLGVALVPDGPWRVHPVGVPLAVAAPDDLAAATAPLRALLAALATPPAARVNVVLVPRLAAPGAPAARAFAALDGLTLAPWLADDGPGGRAVLAALALPDRFTPTVLIGLDGWRRRRPEDVDTLVAHELGHALGLPHGRTAGSLMTPGAHRCLPGLTAPERAALRPPR